MATLSTALVDVVGGRTATLLDKAFEMRTVRDLLMHYPRRLAERGELTDLGALRIDEDVTVVAEVRRSEVKRYRNRPGARLEVVVGDGRNTLVVTFFGTRQTWRSRELTPGIRALFSGKVTVFNGIRQLAHPDYLLLRAASADADPDLDAAAVDEFAGAIIPVYPATKDARSWTVSRAVDIALQTLDRVPDPVPHAVRVRQGLIDRDTALRGMHRPASIDAWAAARHRLTFDEAFVVQVALAQRRAAAAANPATPRPLRPDGIAAAFDRRLPFELTTGQRTVGDQLADELAQPHPMHRLLQGEVGSGKTVVALRAMLQIVDAGGQSALLAPTEVLAAQHARSIEALLGELAHSGRLGSTDLSTRVALLTGSLPTAARRSALLDAAGGAAGIVVGTHALLQEQVSFADLGLVVVDEQHRFGVEQRDVLRGKADRPPHLLVMTATPIPRTVAMTVFGDLDSSVLTELPRGRSPIATTVVPTAERPGWLDRVWTRIREEVQAGRQAYVVCPRIGDGGAEPDLDPADEPRADEPFLGGSAGNAPGQDGAAAGERRPAAAVEDVLALLTEGPLRGLRVAPLHGRLAGDVKDATMTGFAAARIDVLVATTVIEVGVDVANATVMAVLDADRFGVSQLHQLRGRVGRGSAPGLCLMVTGALAGSASRERLDAVAATTDGFALARLDVEQRREGDVLGVAQSGRRSALRLLSLVRDEELIGQARAAAAEVVGADPDLREHPLLAVEVAAMVADDRAEFLDKV